MLKIKSFVEYRTEDGDPVDIKRVNSFRTTNYTGLWDKETHSYALVATESEDFRLYHVGDVNSFAELCREVRNMCGEGIEEISPFLHYKIDFEDL